MCKRWKDSHLSVSGGFCTALLTVIMEFRRYNNMDLVLNVVDLNQVLWFWTDFLGCKQFGLFDEGLTFGCCLVGFLKLVFINRKVKSSLIRLCACFHPDCIVLDSIVCGTSVATHLTPKFKKPLPVVSPHWFFFYWLAYLWHSVKPKEHLVSLKLWCQNTDVMFPLWLCPLEVVGG